jgi:hypothetical protein
VLGVQAGLGVRVDLERERHRTQKKVQCKPDRKMRPKIMSEMQHGSC